MSNKKEDIIFVGSWGADIQESEKEQEASSGGISIYTVRDDGQLALISNFSPEVYAGIMHMSPDGKFLYVTDERKDYGGSYGAGGSLYAYCIEEGGKKLTFLNKVPSVGAYPCYVTGDPDNRFVFICNHGNHDDVVTKVVKTSTGKYESRKVYDDGSIVMYPVREDGSLGECCDVKILSGSSAVERFQWSPHPHSVRVHPSGKYLFCADKGTDHIHVYRIDYEKRSLSEALTHVSPPGTGPRHIDFHPELPVVYVNSEIDSTVHAFEFSIREGYLKLIDMGRSIPDPYTPPDPTDHFARNAPADIRVHPNGRFLYISNRGHNTIASFSLDSFGKMTFLEYTPCGGEIPRAINFNAGFDKLYSVNQRSGNVVEFRIDLETGSLEATGNKIQLNNPVCLLPYGD